jgi:hypothetical protein
MMPTLSQGAPLNQSEVPDALKPWIGWALHNQDQVQCPFIYNAGRKHSCVWPGRFNLSANKTGASFKLTLRSYNQARVTIPGDQDSWPQQVRVNGGDYGVSDQNGRPTITLPPGSHTVEGRFLWDKVPEGLTIPTSIGLVSLELNGKNVERPRFENGRLYFQASEPNAPLVGNSLATRVFRRIEDSIPMEMQVNLNLVITGANREFTLGPLFTKEFQGARIDAPFPVKLENDGTLKMQVRAGRHNVVVTGFNFSPPTKLSFPVTQKKLWPSEVWSFQSRNDLRLVSIEGAKSVDPKQSGVPSEWQNLPAYHMEAGTELSFKQRKRGDPDPAPDKLSLVRNMWLDFDGQGYTIQDLISGQVNRSWRLEITPPAALGSVQIAGDNQLVTEHPGGGQGVELRQSQLRMTADLRVEERTSKVPLGWLVDFQSAQASLHLPPGWRLLSAGGVDEVQGSWIRKWNLMNLFLILIVALAMAKLRNPLMGVVSFFALALIIPEGGGPTVEWLFLLPAMGLLQALPEGKPRWLTVFYFRVVGLIVLCISVLFIVGQVRQSMYPSLERPYQQIGSPGSSRYSEQAVATKSMEEPIDSADYEDESQESDLLDDTASPKAPPSRSRSLKKAFGGASVGNVQNYQAQQQMTQNAPNSIIQTGPGIPQWEWNRINLNWSGPVDQGQSISLWLIPPWANILLSILRVGLLIFMLWSCFGKELQSGLPRLKKMALPLLLGALFTGLFASNAGRAEIPSQEMLRQLRTKLLEAPDCVPHCVSIPRMQMDVNPSRVRLRLDVHAEADVAIPLPGDPRNWWPDQITLDGKQASNLKRDDGSLWISVKPGRHQIEMVGPLNGNRAQIPLPLRPMRVDAQTSGSGISVEGLLPDGKVGDTIVVTATSTKDGGKKKEFEAGVLPPFYEVNRQLSLDINWSINTSIRRLNETSAATILRVPLLAGEQVTTPGIQVQDNHVVVNMGQNGSANWNSTLKISKSIKIEASKTERWIERWSLMVSPIWHITLSGIPVVGHKDQGVRRPTWSPWPGEEAVINVSRPAPVKGRSITLQASELNVAPGKRSSAVDLKLIMRSSQGGDHAITLPEGAALQSVKVNGTTQPISPEKNVLTLPVVPGEQTYQIAWRQKEGMGTFYRLPQTDLGINGVNGKTHITLPGDRWTLFTRGEGLGPAVLLWSQLIVILLAAFCLGQIPITPLKWHHWALLGIGLAQDSLEIALVVVGFFLALGVRQRVKFKSPIIHNLVQIGLGFWAIAVFTCVLSALNNGFFGRPDMQIRGNGSSQFGLQFFVDQTEPVIGNAWVLSVPLLVFQVTMLVWALWFAYNVVKWSKWSYACISADGLFKKLNLTLLKPGVAKTPSGKTSPTPPTTDKKSDE